MVADIFSCHQVLGPASLDVKSALDAPCTTLAKGQAAAQVQDHLSIRTTSLERPTLWVVSKYSGQSVHHFVGNIFDAFSGNKFFFILI